MNKKIIVIIPARMGSERLKNKNILPINKVPMVVPSSRVAQTARGLGFTGELIVAKGATTDAIINAVEGWVWRN